MKDAKMPEGYYKILESDREIKIWNTAIEEAVKVAKEWSISEKIKELKK